MSYQLLLIIIGVSLAGLLAASLVWPRGKQGFNIVLFLALGLLGRLALSTLGKFQAWMAAAQIEPSQFIFLPPFVYLALLLGLAAPFIYLVRSMRRNPGYLAL